VGSELVAVDGSADLMKEAAGRRGRSGLIGYVVVYL
jgi:hypothetical protein